MNIFERNLALLGEGLFEKLQSTHVTVVGLGGVGSAAALALAQLGVGHLTLIDFDVLKDSNLNRHVQATLKDLGREKVIVMKEFLEARFPNIQIDALVESFSKGSTLPPTDFLIDAIDQMTHKISLIEYAQLHSIPFIGSLGMGNRTDPTKLILTKLTKTSDDALARVLRKAVREKHLKDFPVVLSQEHANPVVVAKENGRHLPASLSLVPNAAGLTLAFWVLDQIQKGISYDASDRK